MRRFRSELLKGAVLAAALLPVLQPGALSGQGAPDVVAKTVTMGTDRARLTLEFSDGSDLELGLEDGQVRVGDETVGSYEPGGLLESAWRDLVTRTVQLDDADLPEALVDWAPPEGLEGDAARVASRLDELLARRFDTAAVRIRARTREAEGLDRLGGLGSLALLSRLELLAGLEDVLEGLQDSNLQVVVDDHLEIDAGSEFDGSILVVDGSLEVRGTVRGDVVVVDGEVELYPGSRITGTLNLREAELDNDGGEVSGGIDVLEMDRRDFQEDLRSEILREIRSEISVDDQGGSSWTSPLRSAASAFGSILGTLVNILVLGALGAGLFHFAGGNMETVAQVARESTGRAAVVGLAGSALILPVFVLGIVGLAITIVGIPAILLWVVLFPAAVVIAGLMGYLAVARNLGVWLERQRYGFTDWIRLQNPVTLVFGGLLVLMAPFVFGEVLGIVGFLGILEVLLVITGVSATVFAAAVGFGAVLITRGGRQPAEWGTEFFRGWRGQGGSAAWNRWSETEDDLEEFFEETAAATARAEKAASEAGSEAAEMAEGMADAASEAAKETVETVSDAVDAASETVETAAEAFDEELDRKRREYQAGSPGPGEDAHDHGEEHGPGHEHGDDDDA
ncbi:MAG: hypothetical protein P8188_12830 [Gemmatimonadota bacterium]